MKNCVRLLLVVAVLLPVSLFAMPDTVAVPSDVGSGEGSLNNAIATAITAGKLSTTVFKLEPYGYYVLTGTITVPAGTHLTIIGPQPGTTQATAPPQIFWTPSSGVNTNFNFDCFGDITLKNVWLMYANTGGTQTTSTLAMEDDTVANLSGKGEIGVFDGVIFDYSPCPQNSAGAVSVTSKHFKGTFRNCYFRNCVDTHLRYYGRAVSFPYQTTAWHTDSLSFVNCTFANIGYAYMQESPEYGDHVSFNHCTFLNTVRFTLQSGFWNWLSVTNSIFVNAYMEGDQISQRGTNATFPNGGSVNIDSISTFGFTVPFTEPNRHVLFTNSSYYIEKWLSDYMDHGNTFSDTASAANKANPQPMMSTKTLVFFDKVINGVKAYPYINRANLYDAANPNFILAPTNQDNIKTFLLYKWTTNADINWAYDPTSDTRGIWPMAEALSYTNPTLKTAAMGGFPLGDLYNWWPTKYTQWKAQEATENARISQWLSSGADPGPLSVEERPSIPVKFELSQNYPNPFNPTTEIDYTVPERGYLSLKVFDILGREIATLFSGDQRPGNYAATFDASKFASGIYFYRLQAGSTLITKKAVLMK